MPQNQYINTDNFNWILADLNYSDCDERKKQDLLDRATAGLEADLFKKFIVPLTGRLNVTYVQCPQVSRNTVLNAMRAKIRELIGLDKNRNLVIDSTERFINVHGMEYKEVVKVLLDPMNDFQFLLVNQALDAQTPVQHLGLARANNETDPSGGFFL